MNKVFKMNNKMELDSKYYIESDGDNGIVLIFSEIRTKDKTEIKFHCKIELLFYFEFSTIVVK